MSASPVAPAPDMVEIPGGTFRMGSDAHYPEERPVHDVTVDGFWMDEHVVTVSEFRRFVKATGHVTVAERAARPRGLPRRRPGAARPGLARLPADQRPGRSRTTTGTGGTGSRVPSGGIRKAPAATCRGAIVIRSPMSPTRTRLPTPRGPARSCRPRPSGNARRAAASMARSTPGATSSRPRAG